MEYNKRQNQKVNDKKVLHKVRKQWVTISLAILVAIGGGAIAEAPVHASVTPSHSQTSVNKNDHQNTFSNQSIQKQAHQLHNKVIQYNNQFKNNSHSAIAVKATNAKTNNDKKSISNSSNNLNNSKAQIKLNSKKALNTNYSNHMIGDNNSETSSQKQNPEEVEHNLPTADNQGNKVVLIIDNQGIYRPYVIPKNQITSAGFNLPGIKSKIYVDASDKLVNTDKTPYSIPSQIDTDRNGHNGINNKFYIFDARNGSKDGGTGWQPKLFSETFKPHTDFFSGDTARFGYNKYLGTDSLKQAPVSAPAVPVNNVYDGDPVQVSINNLGSYNHFRDAKESDSETPSDARNGHTMSYATNLFAVANSDNSKSYWLNSQSHFSVVSLPAPSVSLNYYDENNHTTTYSSHHAIDGYYFDPIPELSNFDSITKNGQSLANFYQPDNWVTYYFGTNPTSTINLPLASKEIIEKKPIEFQELNILGDEIGTPIHATAIIKGKFGQSMGWQINENNILLANGQKLSRITNHDELTPNDNLINVHDSDVYDNGNEKSHYVDPLANDGKYNPKAFGTINVIPGIDKHGNFSTTHVNWENWNGGVSLSDTSNSDNGIPVIPFYDMNIHGNGVSPFVEASPHQYQHLFWGAHSRNKQDLDKYNPQPANYSDLNSQIDYEHSLKSVNGSDSVNNVNGWKDTVTPPAPLIPRNSIFGVQPWEADSEDGPKQNDGGSYKCIVQTNNGQKWVYVTTPKDLNLNKDDDTTPLFQIKANSQTDQNKLNQYFKTNHTPNAFQFYGAKNGFYAWDDNSGNIAGATINGNFYPQNTAILQQYGTSNSTDMLKYDFNRADATKSGYTFDNIPVHIERDDEVIKDFNPNYVANNVYARKYKMLIEFKDPYGNVVVNEKNQPITVPIYGESRDTTGVNPNNGVIWFNSNGDFTGNAPVLNAKIPDGYSYDQTQQFDESQAEYNSDQAEGGRYGFYSTNGTDGSWLLGENSGGSQPHAPYDNNQKTNVGYVRVYGAPVAVKIDYHGISLIVGWSYGNNMFLPGNTDDKAIIVHTASGPKIIIRHKDGSIDDNIPQQPISPVNGQFRIRVVSPNGGVTSTTMPGNIGTPGQYIESGKMFNTTGLTAQQFYSLADSYHEPNAFSKWGNNHDYKLVKGTPTLGDDNGTMTATWYYEPVGTKNMSVKYVDMNDASKNFSGNTSTNLGDGDNYSDTIANPNNNIYTVDHISDNNHLAYTNLYNSLNNGQSSNLHISNAGNKDNHDIVIYLKHKTEPRPNQKCTLTEHINYVIEHYHHAPTATSLPDVTRSITFQRPQVYDLVTRQTVPNGMWNKTSDNVSDIHSKSLKGYQPLVSDVKLGNYYTVNSDDPLTTKTSSTTTAQTNPIMNITVGYVSTSEDVKKITEKINYQVDGNSSLNPSPNTQTITFIRPKSENLHNGGENYGKWKAIGQFNNINSPSVNGYTPDKNSVTAPSIDMSNPSNDKNEYDYTVVYHTNSAPLVPKQNGGNNNNAHKPNNKNNDNHKPNNNSNNGNNNHGSNESNRNTNTSENNHINHKNNGNDYHHNNKRRNHPINHYHHNSYSNRKHHSVVKHHNHNTISNYGNNKHQYVVNHHKDNQENNHYIKHIDSSIKNINHSYGNKKLSVANTISHYQNIISHINHFLASHSKDMSSRQYHKLIRTRIGVESKLAQAHKISKKYAKNVKRNAKGIIDAHNGIVMRQHDRAYQHGYNKYQKLNHHYSKRLPQTGERDNHIELSVEVLLLASIVISLLGRVIDKKKKVN